VTWIVVHPSCVCAILQALTASATAAVERDIIAQLGLSPRHLYRCVEPFNRTNLYYEVRHYHPSSLPLSAALLIIHGAAGPIPSGARSVPYQRRRNVHQGIRKESARRPVGPRKENTGLGYHLLSGSCDGEFRDEALDFTHSQPICHACNGMHCSAIR
jgi:hypothetical protein